MKRVIIYVVVFLFLLFIIVVVGTRWIDIKFGSNVSAWVQAGIAVVSFPIILFQLEQIRQSVNQKPKLEIGVINIRALPFSNVRLLAELPTRTDVGRGYAHFYLVLRNTGAAPARYIKIYVEHINKPHDFQFPPLVKPDEFSDEKPAFVKEHNWDLVFRAGTEWIVNTGDIEPFGFHLTTSFIVNDVNGAGATFQRPEYPSLGEIELNCTVWADGLERPLTKKLFVQIVERLEREHE
ncbi:MAG: hypothetical protein ABI690_00055 [Chloroflexota bacterium]